MRLFNIKTSYLQHTHSSVSTLTVVPELRSQITAATPMVLEYVHTFPQMPH
jgi:hypothetical protein